MENLLARFLESSHIEPVYFLAGVADVIAFFLWKGLKQGMSEAQRAFYKAVILVAILLTAGCLSRYFGFIKDWKELEAIWRF